MIQNTPVTTTPTVIFNSPGPHAITTVYLCNYTSNTVSIDMHAVPAGSVVSNDTIIYKNIVLVKEETYIMDMEKLLTNDQDKLYVTASAPASVSATISAYPL